MAAVSGGIDSMVMLDVLAKAGVKVLVAHINHGMRRDSDDDELFVKAATERYGFSFVSTRLRLGPSASEDTARRARHTWLDTVSREHGSIPVATAHHRDDIIETVIINLLRGTGWRGLCSLTETAARKRPLIQWDKADVIQYALEHRLTWRDDSTNDNPRYLRNRIRMVVMPRIDPVARRQLLDLYTTQVALRAHIEKSVRDLLAKDPEPGIRRYHLIMSDDAIAAELLRGWLEESLETARYSDLLHFAKTARPGALWSLDGRRFVRASKDRLIVTGASD